ncbi:MAG: lipopolysaccharide kinase InaA family protein [Bacteroidales bacterium]|nr:lipopolysaccharide kinase InaA family protein [Bacteroidales bacterium]MDD4657108.1 lipopolysaccharide kinase InaA family protein [Bacteroidales bacterium]
MREELFVKEKFIGLKPFIESIPESFDSVGKTIYKGRNIVKVVEKDGVLLTIKYFKKIFFLNKFVYAYIRKSKAQRSYENSETLALNGITTPEPVAWVNCYKNSLLNKSYYISLFTDYYPLEQLFEQSIYQNRDVIKEFARFSSSLHKKGIFHKDFNVTNVLFSTKNGELDFSLIDNNRMKFSNYSYSKGIRNMRRLTVDAIHLEVIAEGYAKEIGLEEPVVLKDLAASRAKFLKRYLFKRELKQKIRRLFI